MLIGAHLSPAGGVHKAVERAAERGARALQIFNQNPRAWKPREYPPEAVAAYHDAFASSNVDALLIHAVYLLNCASEDDDIRAKSLTSLIASLRAGALLGAHAVVLHPGSALRGDPRAAIARAGETIAEALAESDGCDLHLENTAGAGGTLGRSFEELAALLDAAGSGPRLGVCLDSCHLFASGYDIRTTDDLADVVGRFHEVVGLDRLRSLHLNDSQTPLGSNRDRHATVGEGELGDEGCGAFVSEPRFEGLPCVIETSGPDNSGPSSEELAHVAALRERGLAARAV
jgi:deoxyribonuclease-4